MYFGLAVITPFEVVVVVPSGLTPPSVEVVALFNALKIQTFNTYDVGDITILFLPIGNLLITSSYRIMFLI